MSASSVTIAASRPSISTRLSAARDEHEPTETGSREGSSRPNSWQASAVSTRAGSPHSHHGSPAPGQACIRKPSSAHAPTTTGDPLEGLPPLPSLSNPFESEPTWVSLAEHTAGAIQNLIHSAEHGYKAHYQVQAAQVVESVRVMLYASGTVDKDSAPIRQHRSLKVYHRQIMAALSRLVLSAKMASSVWNVEGAVMKMRSDADDVANSVHQFITTAQDAGVGVHDVDAKLILDPEGPFEPRNAKMLSRTLSNASRPSLDGSDKSSYRRSSSSAGVLAQLDYYCKSATKATDLLSLQLAKIMEGSQNGHSSPIAPSSATQRRISSSFMNSAQSSQLVTQCQQAISQIGSLLALVSEYYALVMASHPTIKDHIFLDVRVSKQALYNNVAALVMAVQLATDTMAQITVLEMAMEAISTVERSVTDLTSAARSLAIANDETERQVRARSDTSSTLVGQPSYSSFHRLNDMEAYSPDLDSELDGDNRPTSPLEISPPTASRPAASITQKASVRGAKLKKMLGEDAPTPKPIKIKKVPWYLEHDYSQADISFNMEGHVRGGTLPALVERLTQHDGLDANFVATFLLTYRSFATTEQFFTLLFRRFTISPPEGLSPNQLAHWTDLKLTPTRLRVLNTIKSWLENYYLEDEVDDRQMLPRIKEFSDSSLMRETMSIPAVQLIKLVEKRETSDGSLRKMVLNLTTQAPQPITPRNLKKIKFLELDPLELARQLTIMEATVYNKIRPVECLAKAWTSEDVDIAAKAVNIKRIIETSNLYANWINEIVLSEKEVKKRAAIIRHLISVAEKLRHLNNFDMLSATTAALAQSPIHRLKRTWELVPTKVMTNYTTLQAVTSSAKNWGDYRQELHSANPPCVPFVGVYLTDLVMIQDGNPDFLKGAEQHINFYKRVSTAEVIREIQQYQAVPYCLTLVPEIQAFIRRGLDNSKNVAELYEMSLALEPREGEEEKITRLLSESGFL
ncbi:hypothetical protein BGZ75_008142 [Mortierella antarctica]|nr:hypothetical protein BGZ75_008142 [Mortierella antarctica]